MTDALPILDEQAMHDLRQSVGGDDAFVADLAATYIAEGAQEIAQIETAAAAGDLELMIRPAHSLKSASASLGAARMAEISRQLEYAAREGRAGEIPGLVAAARAAWDETAAQLRARGLAE